MAFGDPLPQNWCLAPTQDGGLCRRYKAGPETLSHCWQHGGRAVDYWAQRFLAGASIESLAAELAEKRPELAGDPVHLWRCTEYIEDRLRVHAGGEAVKRWRVPAAVYAIAEATGNGIHDAE